MVNLEVRDHDICISGAFLHKPCSKSFTCRVVTAPKTLRRLQIFLLSCLHLERSHEQKTQKTYAKPPLAPVFRKDVRTKASTLPIQRGEYFSPPGPASEFALDRWQSFGQHLLGLFWFRLDPSVSSLICSTVSKRMPWWSWEKTTTQCKAGGTPIRYERKGHSRK